MKTEATLPSPISRQLIWKKKADYSDLRYEQAHELDGTPLPIAKITINRPEVRNAFRPKTVSELRDAFETRARRRRHRGDPG